MNSLHVKKGDTVTVITGKDKGKTGKIVRAFPARNMVVVEGLNLKNRRVRARKQKEKGQSVQMAAPIHASNVRLSSEVKKKPAAKKASKKAAK